MGSKGLSVLVFVLALCVGVPVRAAAEGNEGDEDFDRIDRADELQASALAAADAGDWEEARRLAETVLTLDDGVATAPSRLVLARALEKEASYDAALYELKQYLELELDPEAREEGLRLEARLNAKKDGTFRRPRRPLSPNGRVGLGLLLGGVVPTAVGGWFVGTDVYWSAVRVPSGTWAAIGTPILLTGLTLDVVGLIVLLKSRKVSGHPVARRRPPVRFRAGVVPAPDGWALSLGATW